MASKSHLPNGTMYMRDWRKSLSASPTYRIGSATLRFHFHFAFMAFCFGTLILIFLYYKPSSMSSYSTDDSSLWSISRTASQSSSYNHSYPLSSPLSSNGMVTFRIGLIADLDQMSAKPNTKNTWQSYYKKGHLSYSVSQQSVAVSFDEDQPIPLVHHYALKGRGMELSELVTFNGRLLTFDDRTGFVYELAPDDNRVIPWVVMMDGDGRSSKGFKSEWATVKDDMLYVGSMGKEWTTAHGDFESFDPMWVKVVSTSGNIHHLNWVEKYKKIRAAMGIQWPGYMIHESGMWSPIHKLWFFLPRRCSHEKYNETKDEHNGCNVLITADESFNTVRVIKLGDLKPTHGFSSMKFVPNTGDTIVVALLTEELNMETSTFITAFTIDGQTLLPQQRIDTKLKYEGLDFI